MDFKKWVGIGIEDFTPARLHKQNEEIKNFYPDYIVLAAIIMLLIIFCVICFLICGVSATESGMMRNFINGGYL